jgi:hypothetical protein
MPTSRIMIYLLICWFMTGCATAKLTQYATTLEADPALDKIILDCNEEAKVALNNYAEEPRLSKKDYDKKMTEYELLKEIYDDLIKKDKEAKQKMKQVIKDNSTDNRTKYDAKVKEYNTLKEIYDDLIKKDKKAKQKMKQVIKDNSTDNKTKYETKVNEYNALKVIYDELMKKDGQAKSDDQAENDKKPEPLKAEDYSALIKPSGIEPPPLPKLASIPSGYKLDSFMNCFFGMKIKQNELGLRLLRGHYIVAALSRYGATSVMAYPIKPKRDATNIPRRIEHAERLLKNGLDSLDTAPDGKGEVKKVDRILAVQELVAESMKPFIRNSRNWFDNVFSAIQGNPFKVLELAEDTGDIIRRTLRVKLFGSAFRQDIREKLIDARDGNIQKHWDYFNSTLETACTSLGSIANVKHQCIVK